MRFGPDYVKKLIDEANLLLKDKEIDAKTKAAIWCCLQAVEKSEKYRNPPMQPDNQTAIGITH